MKKRLFIGIPVLAPLADELIELQNNILAPSDLRWVPRENLHLTLCFLGSVSEDHIAELSERLERIVSEQSPFTMDFEGLQVVSKGREHMLWFQLIDHQSWNQLVEEVRKSCESFWERPPRHSKQVPHITLARSKAAISISDTPWNLKHALTVDRVALYESLLDHRGSRYTVLSSFPLTHE